MKHEEGVTIIKGDYNDSTLKGIIGRMSACIGFRYHFLVFATTTGVPTIGVYLGEYYKQKITGIMTLMGQEKYALNLENIDSREIIEFTKEALQNKEAIAKELGEKTNLLGELSLTSIRYAAKLLGGEDLTEYVS